MKYRQMGLHERHLMDEVLLRLMNEEYTFVTRPVVVRGDHATAGSSTKRIDELIAESCPPVSRVALPEIRDQERARDRTLNRKFL
jgi:hypothetical protein